MSTADGEYLYIVQLCEDVLANRNVYKFGMTKQANPYDRISPGYSKGSRIWMVIITNNARDQETELKQLFKSKYKWHKTDKGDEYYEPPDVQDMMNDLWNYRNEHFKNIYMPEELNCENYFKHRMNDKLVHDEREQIHYFKASDVTRSDFAYYLYSNGWKLDSKRQLILINDNDYESFVEHINATIETTNNDQVINNEQPTSNVTNNAKESTKSVHKAKYANNINDNSNTEPVKHKNEVVSKPPVKETKEPKPVKEVLLPRPALSIEQFVDLISKYITTKCHKQLQNFSLKITTSYNNSEPYILNVSNIDIYENNNSYKSFASIEDIMQISKHIDANKIRLSASKYDKFRKVFQEGENEYVLHIDSLLKKRFKPKDSMRFVKYNVVRFDTPTSED